MYLFYDNQGNLMSANNQDIVVQNSNNANFIFVNIKGIDYAQYSAIATFEVPSASADTVQLIVTNNLTTLDYNEKKILGYIVWLNDAITYYTGDVKFTLSLTKLGTSTRLNLQEFTFHVDESTTSGEPWDAYINQAQYENLMNYITGEQISFDYLGEIRVAGSSISQNDFYDKFSEPLLKDKSQGYYLVYGLINNRTPINILVSSYIMYGEQGTEHFVYAVYRNDLTKQFEAIGYKEIFDLDTTNYFDYSENTGTTATDNATWNDGGTATIGAESGEVSITLPISEIGLNVGEHVAYSFDASARRFAFAGSAYVYLLDENLEELTTTSFSFSFVGSKTIYLYGIEIIENAKFIKLVVNKATPPTTTLSNFAINKYKEIMLPTTLTPDDVEYITEYSTNYQNLIDTINDNIRDINSTVTSLEQDVSSLQQNVATINTTIGTLPYTCELTMNSQTYVVTLNLKDAKGTTLSMQSIDLPLESTVVSGSYDESNKAIILTLKSGETISIPIGDLVDGLVSQTDFDNLESEVNLIDERLTAVEETIADTRIGITSQYVSQPSNVKVGSNIYINAKLRDSVNLLDVANSSIYSSTGTTASKDDNNSVILRFDEPNEGTGGYAYITPTLTSLGLQVGDTITFSAVCNISDTTKRYSLTISFRNSEGTQISLVEVGKFGNSGEQLSMTTIIPQGTTSMHLNLVKRAKDIISSGTTFTFSNIQLQKGNVATAYEPFGAHSKGKVMQYASKNILNLPSCTEVSISSVNGSQTSSNTYERASASATLRVGMRGSQPFAKYVKGHKYALLIHSTDNDFSEFTEVGCTLYGINYAFIANNVDEYFVTGTPNVLAIIATWTAETQIGMIEPYFIGGSSLSITVDKRAVIDITSAGLHEVSNLTQYVDGWSQQLATLASGGSISKNMYRSPLIKVFDENLYLTKPSGYTLTIYEFKENPKSLNANVDIDDYEFIKASEYSSSGAITLQLNTNSIVYFLYASSSTNLSTWQTTSQLEYGNVATEHSDYTAPIEIGTFDKSVDGNEKIFSFVVLSTENQNIGFIPLTENDISIDYAENVGDLTSSTFAYQSTNLATQVAELTQRVEDLESQVASILEMLNNN